MEIYINELSLEGQYHDQTQFTEGVKGFIAIFSIIKKDIKDAKLFKDGLYLFAAHAIRDENFLASFQKISDKSLKVAFRGIVLNKLNPVDWRPERIHSTEDAYFYMENEDFLDASDRTLAEIAERNIQHSEVRRLAINFVNSTFSGLSEIPVLKNSEEAEPIIVDCCEDKDSLSNWIGHISTPVTDFLRNKERFESTQKIAPKVRTKIYREIATGYYWYFDNFHADEFEVCDKLGKHIGVANSEGEIDFDKAVEGRSISNVL